MTMEELMPVGQWKRLEAEINQATGLNAAVFDAHGTRVTNVALWGNTLCPLIKSNSASAQAICSVAHQEIARQAQLTRQAAVAECDAGMLKICVPIFAKHLFVGIAGGCGRFLVPDHLESFHISQLTGLPVAEIEELAAGIPCLTDLEVQAATDFIAGRVEEILRVAV